MYSFFVYKFMYQFPFNVFGKLQMNHLLYLSFAIYKITFLILYIVNFDTVIMIYFKRALNVCVMF